MNKNERELDEKELLPSFCYFIFHVYSFVPSFHLYDTQTAMQFLPSLLSSLVLRSDITTTLLSVVGVSISVEIVTLNVVHSVDTPTCTLCPSVRSQRML